MIVQDPRVSLCLAQRKGTQMFETRSIAVATQKEKHREVDVSRYFKCGLSPSQQCYKTLYLTEPYDTLTFKTKKQGLSFKLFRRDDADDTFNTLAAPQPTNGQYRYILGGWRNGRLQPGKVIHNPDFHGGTSVAPVLAITMFQLFQIPLQQQSSTWPTSTTASTDTSDSAQSVESRESLPSCRGVHGDSVVHLADGQCIAVASLRKGDIVQSGVGGATARIECIVRSQCPRRQALQHSSRHNTFAYDISSSMGEPSHAN
eukprot:755503-Amphidinium_carterae.1